MRTRLIVGLGNPGKEYENTRHNAGMMATAALREKLAAAGATVSESKKFSALVWQSTKDGIKTIILEPQTYMNDSGDAVAAAAQFWKVAPTDTFVIYDDKDIPFGTLRLRRSGSDGGHRGMRSIIEMLGTRDFPRLRIGIAAEKHPDQSTADFVLGKFTAEERAALKPILAKSVDVTLAFIAGGFEDANRAMK